MNKSQKKLVSSYNQELKKVKWKNLNCVCGSNRNFKIYNKDRHGILSPVFICINCGTLRSNPVPPNDVVNKLYSNNLYQKIYSSLDIEALFS